VDAGGFLGALNLCDNRIADVRAENGGYVFRLCPDCRIEDDRE
jgi:hypothetical protein